MKRSVVFRRVAEEEFLEAIDWYNRAKVGLGDEFKSAVESMLTQISRTPERFAQTRHESRRAVMSRFPYTIHFWIEPERIVVIAVFHKARDPEDLSHRY